MKEHDINENYTDFFVIVMEMLKSDANVSIDHSHSIKCQNYYNHTTGRVVCGYLKGSISDMQPGYKLLDLSFIWHLLDEFHRYIHYMLYLEGSVCGKHSSHPISGWQFIQYKVFPGTTVPAPTQSAMTCKAIHVYGAYTLLSIQAVDIVVNSNVFYHVQSIPSYDLTWYINNSCRGFFMTTRWWSTLS